MISPLVRRLRLRNELVRLRKQHGYSAIRLADAIGVARQRISELENGHVAPDLDHVARILGHLEVDQVKFEQLMAVAQDAREQGWWARDADKMGSRQARYANLEAGASEIFEYQMVFLPGLLQIPEYTGTRARIDRRDNPGSAPDHALQARANRQRMLQRPAGPAYQAVIDEMAVRRFAAAPYIVAAQLDHIVHQGHERESLTIRVLPVAAAIAGYAVPRSAFFIYRYPDPADPQIVAVDTVTDDLLLTAEAEVDRYLDLYRKLTDAALPPADSLDFLARVAEELRKETHDA